jgi:hypothetical protein
VASLHQDQFYLQSASKDGLWRSLVILWCMVLMVGSNAGSLVSFLRRLPLRLLAGRIPFPSVLTRTGGGLLAGEGVMPHRAAARYLMALLFA